jgi:hypothetical protein
MRTIWTLYCPVLNENVQLEVHNVRQSFLVITSVGFDVTIGIRSLLNSALNWKYLCAIVMVMRDLPLPLVRVT